MTFPHPEPYLSQAWRRVVPDATDDEIRTLLPLIKARAGLLGMVINAYRLGRRDATPLPVPLAGFQPCGNCLSVNVATLGFDGPPAGTVLVARCADCACVYVAATGNPVVHAAPGSLDPGRPADAGRPCWSCGARWSAFHAAHEDHAPDCTAGPIADPGHSHDARVLAVEQTDTAPPPS